MTEVKADQRTQTVRLTLDSQETSADRIREALDEAGFSVNAEGGEQG